MIERIWQDNLEFLEIDYVKFATESCENLISKLIQDYPIDNYKNITIISGMAGNGMDGMILSKLLAEKNYKIDLLLVKRPQKIELKEAADYWFKEIVDDPRIKTVVEATSTNLNLKSDLYIEAIAGTGFDGKATKSPRDIIKKLTDNKKKIIAIDKPFPGYTPVNVYSFEYAKHKDAIVITNRSIDPLAYFGPGYIKNLVHYEKSHIVKNGKVLVVGRIDNIDELKFLKTPIDVTSISALLENTNKDYKLDSYNSILLITNESLGSTLLEDKLKNSISKNQKLIINGSNSKYDYKENLLIINDYKHINGNIRQLETTPKLTYQGRLTPIVAGNSLFLEDKGLLILLCAIFSNNNNFDVSIPAACFLMEAYQFIKQADNAVTLEDVWGRIRN